MTAGDPRRFFLRRRLLQGAGALSIVPWVRVRAAELELPAIPALAELLAGRTPRRGRVHLELPQLADNGLVVPIRITVDGPFAPGPHVRAIHLFAETNPVPEMAVFEFPVPVERVEVESRVRLAGTQRIVAVTAMSDATLHATAAEVIVTIAGCLDGT